MRTLFISGSDTGIGKTRLTGILAALLPDPGETVQIVKPVETGLPADVEGDAAAASTLARDRGRFADARTLFRFPAALAPVAAAENAGKALKAAELLAAMSRPPACDWRFVEGAGGIAVPIEANGCDWADFAVELGMVHVVLVVPDRLGAINQGRLAAHYVQSKGLRFSMWLNETEPQPAEIRRSNRCGLEDVGISPVFTLDHNANGPGAEESVRAFYRNVRAPLTSPSPESPGKTPGGIPEYQL